MTKTQEKLKSYISTLQEQQTMLYSFWIESKKQDERQLIQYNVLDNVVNELRRILEEGSN